VLHNARRATLLEQLNSRYGASFPTAALIRVLESTPPFDAVVIEASGVSDPWRIAEVGLADPGLALDGVIVVLDASAALDQARNPLLADSLERQLRSADLIVVNKTDLVDASERGRVREWAASVANAAPVFETAHAEVPLPLLTSVALLPPQDRHRDNLAACEAAAHEHDGAWRRMTMACCSTSGRVGPRTCCRPRLCVDGCATCRRAYCA
jgi:G3E family GTPase